MSEHLLYSSIDDKVRDFLIDFLKEEFGLPRIESVTYLTLIRVWYVPNNEQYKINQEYLAIVRLNSQRFLTNYYFFHSELIIML